MKRVRALAHGQPKEQKQFLITPDASKLLDKLSTKTKLSRSEIVERLIRMADVNAIKKYGETENTDD